jgi:hypothetical protein
MIINTTRFGRVEVSIEVDSFSAVDSYISEAYSLTLDRELTDAECDYLTQEYDGAVQSYAWNSGQTLNHN